MKRILGLMLAGVLLLGTTAAFAAEGCGGGAADAPKAAKCSLCDAALSKMKLTDDQKTKIAALKEECQKVGCSIKGREKCLAGLKEILTAEQFAEVKAATEKAGKGGCGAAKE